MLSVIHVQIRHPSRSSSSKRRLQRSCFWSRFSSSAKRRLTGGNRLQGVPPLHSEWTSRASPSPQRWIRFMGVPFSNANRIRLIEAPTLSRWSSSPSGWGSPQGVPPTLYSEWDSLQGGPLLFLQVIEIHLKGLPLSTANGIRFRGVPSKANGIRLLGVPPLSRGFPSPSEWDSPQGASPLHSEWDSLQGSPLLQREWDSPQGGSPIQSQWESPQGVSSSPMRMGFASRGSPSPKRIIFASRDSPSPERQCFASTNPAWSRHQHSSCASSENNPFERPLLRSSPTIHLPFQRR